MLYIQLIIDTKALKSLQALFYYDTIIGSENYEYKKGETFVPYEDTEAFENVVIGWLEDSLDVASMQNTIAQSIQSQLTPVNEDLYFTWMTPTPNVEKE